MQLTDLLNHVSRLWTAPQKVPGRKVMIIPYIKDITNSLQAGKVAAQCQLCATQLAGQCPSPMDSEVNAFQHSPHLYVWRKQTPDRSTLKLWSVETMSFVGMTIEDFANFVMANFTVKTSDGREWLLDKVVADRIWQSCTDADSPLPEASWEVEIGLKRKAMLNPLDSTSEFGNSQTPARK